MSGNLTMRKHKRQAGFTMLEVLFAGVVLAVGLLAITGLFATAIGNNGRSRLDTTATMLSQAVIEQITAVLARGGPAQVTDCKGNVFAIATSPGGAQLSGSGISFTETNPPAGYWMNSGSQTGFIVCDGGGGEAGTETAYDVRWHISVVTPSGGTDCSETCLVTVAARPLNLGPARFSFALPVTFRTFVGPQ